MLLSRKDMSFKDIVAVLKGKLRLLMVFWNFSARILPAWLVQNFVIR